MATLTRIEALPGDRRYAVSFERADGTEQTAVMASSLSMVMAPHSAASIMPRSSDSGMKAPDNPPT